MSDPDQPKGQHRFAKGHQKFGGRQKGGPNKNLREHAITGLTRGGANKAKKAGKNGNINGLAYFFEDLAEKNSSAAAALAGKLISSESEQKTNAGDYTMPIMIGDPVRDADLLKAAAPLEHAAEIKVPVMMAFGAEDRRVPVEHGTRMRAAMKAAGHEPEYIVYPGEGHGWLKLENRIDFWQRVEKFLAKHLN